MRRFAFITMVVANCCAALPTYAAETKFMSKHTVLDSFASCIAKQHPGAAREFMKTDPGSKEEDKAGLGLARRGSNCTGYRDYISMRSDQLRGSVAHALIAGDPLRSEKIMAMPPIKAARIEKLEGSMFVAAFSQCVAAASPTAAFALVKTERASPSEREAVLFLGETMKACMPVGLAYPINIPELRNHVAISLYKMSEMSND